MNELLRLWDGFKYIEFKPEDKVFEFMRLARVNQNDQAEKWEAIGFFYGCKLKGE